MKVALVLSGGGARGFAHIGCIQALNECGIQTMEISGVSAGAVVGAFIAAGYSTGETKKIIKEHNFLKQIKPAFSFGLLDTQNIQKTLLNYFPENSFSQLKLPFTICTTDMLEGRSVYFNEGELIKPIAASMSLPVLFKPVLYKNYALLDGGILNNLPIEPLLQSQYPIIGIHVNPIQKETQLQSSKQVIARSILLSSYGNVMPRIKQCHYFIEPFQLGKFSLFDFNKIDELVKIGYDYTLNFIQQSHLKPL